MRAKYILLVCVPQSLSCLNAVLITVLIEPILQFSNCRQHFTSVTDLVDLDIKEEQKHTAVKERNATDLVICCHC